MNGKTYQDWCVDVLVGILKRQNEYICGLNEPGVKNAIKSLITHYASHHYCGNEKFRVKGYTHLNVWWNILNRVRWEYVFSKLLLSCKAKEKIEQIHAEGSYKRAKKHIHFEHITPGEQIFELLVGLKNDVSRESVQECLKYNKLIVLTKCETNYLDGKGAVFEVEDIAYLKKFFDITSDEDCNTYIGKSAKSNGCALLRIARLMRNGVCFCHLKGEAAKENAIVAYLNSDFIM